MGFDIFVLVRGWGLILLCWQHDGGLILLWLQQDRSLILLWWQQDGG